MEESFFIDFILNLVEVKFLNDDLNFDVFIKFNEFQKIFPSNDRTIKVFDNTKVTLDELINTLKNHFIEISCRSLENPDNIFGEIKSTYIHIYMSHPRITSFVQFQER